MERVFLMTRWLGAAVWLCACAGAFAQRGSIADAAGRAPADADLVLVVEGASEWRRAPMGELAWRLTASLLDPGASTKAWEALSKQLGLTTDGAFDALLGRRAMFVQSSPADGSTWAIVSSVDRATETLLREKLKPAPRRIEKGLSIMTVEDGRFYLAVVREGEQTQLLLGPTAAPAMFDRLAPTLAQPVGAERGTMGAGPIAGELRDLERAAAAEDRANGERSPPRALLLARWVGAEEGWSGFLASPRKRDVGIEMFIRAPAFARVAPRVKPWSRDVFDELQRGSLLTVMGCSVNMGVLGGDFPAMAQGILMLTGRPWWQDLLGQRWALTARASETAVVSVGVGFETRDIEALAPKGDEMIGGLLQSTGLAGAGAEGGEENVLLLGGEFWGAMRSVDLSQRLGQSFPKWFDRGPSLSWRYAMGGSEGGKTGWWVMGLDAPGVTEMARVVAADRKVKERATPWVMLGMARPSALLGEFSRRGIVDLKAMGGFWGALQRIEQVSWQVFRAGEDVGRGRIVVRGEATTTR